MGITYLYDGDGKLCFSGGIIFLRGYVGFNSGSAEVMNIVRSNAGSGTHPVFGCAINK